MILTLNLRANIILSYQFDVEWTLNIELCLLGVNILNFLKIGRQIARRPNPRIVRKALFLSKVSLEI